MLAVATVLAQPDPAPVLAAARTALGGDSVLAGVKTFTVSGEHMRLLGGNRMTTTIEIACELPDKFVREDNSVGPFSITNRSGFNGDALISQTIAPDSPGPIVVSSGKETPEVLAARRKSAVLMRKQDFAKLMLGLFAKDFSAYPLEFAAPSPATLPGGPADVMDVTSEGKLTFQLFIDAATHRPVMISWFAPPVVEFSSRPPMAPMSQQPGPVSPPMLPGTGSPTPTGTQPPPGTVVVSAPPLVNPTPAELERRAKLVKEQAAAIAAASGLVEHRLVFSDVREADGLRWPHKVTEYVEDAIVDELKLGKFKINARVNPSRFKVSK